MSKLINLRIERFKRVSDASCDLKNLNVLVGGNNAGKSSLIQGLHFAMDYCKLSDLKRSGRQKNQRLSAAASALIN